MGETTDILTRLQDEDFARADVPIPNSWWVWPGRLLAGPYPGSSDLTQARENMQRLVESGVDVIINLQEEDETNSTGQYFLPYRHHVLELQPKLLYLRLPVRDMTPPTLPSLQWMVLEIDRLLNEGRRVYIHCWGGHGRSGTVAGAWLIHHGVEPKHVLSELARRRVHNEHLRLFQCPQTRDQQRMVKRFPRNDA